MAKTRTLLQLIASVRAAGDFQEPFFPKAELTDWINESRDKLYGILGLLDSQRYSDEDDISITPGTGSYALPSDFLNLNGVEVDDSSMASGRRTMNRYNYKERNNYTFNSNKYAAMYDLRGSNITIVPKPQWTGTIYLDYTPTLADLSADGDTFDGVNSWHTYIINDSAAKCARKEKTDPSEYTEARDSSIANIAPVAKMDQANPRTVVDTRGARRSRRRGRYGGTWR